MSKIILPIEENPLFLSRYESSVYFCVIQAQAKKFGKDISPWLAGQMANFHHSTSFLWEFDTIKKMDWYANQKLFFKKLYQFDNRMPGWNRQEIQDLLIRSIQQGKYIHSKMNTFFLPEDVSYQNFHRTVECLLYGVDIDKKEFYYIRFFPSQPISLCFASFDNVMNAICEKADHQILLDILQFNEEFVFQLDEKALYNDLYDFLHATRQYPSMKPNQVIRYGIASFKDFRDYLADVGLYYEYIDRKYVTSFFDFQTITAIRFRYLQENGYLSAENADFDHSQLPILSKRFLTDCIDFNQTQNGKILKKIIESFDRIFEIDVRLSQVMYDSMKIKLSKLCCTKA